MPKIPFTQKQKNEILKKVERKTIHHFEEIQHAQERQSADTTLEQEFKTI